MAEEIKNGFSKKYIHIIIGIAIMTIFSFLEPIEPITPMGMRIIGLFIGTLYLWSTVDALWPSFFAIVITALMGYEPIAKALADSLGSSTVWMFIAIFALFGAMDEIGLTDRIIAKCLSSPLLRGHPWLFTSLIFVTQIIIANTVGALVSTLLMWEVIAKVRDLTTFKNGDRWLHLMVMGAAFTGASSTIILPFRSMMMISLMDIVTKATGLTANYTQVMLFALPMVFIIMAIYILMMRYVFKTDVSPLMNLDPSAFKQELGPMTSIQKVMLTIFSLWLLTLFAGSYLPKGTWTAAKYNSMAAAGVTILFFCIASIIEMNGKPLVRFQATVQKIPWGMIIMIGCAIFLATIITDKSTGILPALTQVLTPFLQGHSAYIFIALILATSVLLTNIANNMVIATMMCPILISINAIQPFNLLGAIVLLHFAVNFALILPSGSPVAAVLFSHEMCDIKNHFKFSIMAVALATIALIVIGYPLAALFIK
jgi:hypothetical protein